jgi:hypothetical protein
VTSKQEKLDIVAKHYGDRIVPFKVAKGGLLPFARRHHQDQDRYMIEQSQTLAS